MKFKITSTLILVTFFTSTLANNQPLQKYTENNTADVSFDVSMPIDSTGFILQGNHLKGGVMQLSNSGYYFNPLLADESGTLQLPVVTDTQGRPLIKTTVKYQDIKFINPNGIHNFFIKVGMGTRTQIVNGLDPKILKNGAYTWQAPIFAVGQESDTVNNKSQNIQFMQVGSAHGGPASANVEYTQDFYLYSKGAGDMPIMGQPIKTNRANQTLSKPYTSHYTCEADGLWGAGGADPYRTLTGKCQGSSTTLPAGPNLDYEYGSFTLPIVHSPWSATPSDHCIFPGNKKRSGCVNISIKLNLHYIAQIIRVPIDKHTTLFAESGTAYRNIMPTNLRYGCKGNVYLKGILPEADCMKKSYLPGGASYTYFAVGYDYQANNGTHYEAKYINIPGQENGNRLVWLDTSNTTIYAIGSSSNSQMDKEARNHLIAALNVIRKNQPIAYNLIGKDFLANILMKNK